MDRLNQSAINDVLNTEPIIRAEVLYKYLVVGISHRQIEKEKPELIMNHGWSSWKIVQFFGFGKVNKGQFSKLKFQNLVSQIQDIDLKDLTEYHLENNTLLDDEVGNDGTDVLRELKIRVGQAKLRKKVIKNYNNKCAFCEIKMTDLLVASHIKPWAKSSQQERINPQNTILLCKLHDALFDKGHISLNDNLEVLFKDKKLLEAQGIYTSLIFSIPKKDEPSINFLNEHRAINKII